MKKKVMSALLATTLVAGLTACGGAKSTDTAASQPEAVDTPVAAETTDAEATEAAPSGETAGTITLGVIGPMTGSLAVYGTHIENGVELAVEQINAAGGVNVGGQMYEIALNSKDDQGDST